MMVKLQFQKVSNIKLDYLENCVLCCVTQLALRENGDEYKPSCHMCRHTKTVDGSRLTVFSIVVCIVRCSELRKHWEKDRQVFCHQSCLCL